MFRYSLILSVLILAACGGLNVEKTPLAPVIERTQDAKPAPVGFNKIRFAVPTGTPVASNSPRGVLGLMSCEYPYGLTQTGVRGGGFPTENFREIFFETLESQGYDVAGNPGRLFDEMEDSMRALYAVGGSITVIKMDTCRKTNIWGISRGETGEAAITVDWTVYDLLKRRNVYKITTKGYTELKHANQDSTALMIEYALAAAIHNLGADRTFYNLVQYGENPGMNLETYSETNENPAEISRLFNPQDPVNITLKPISRTLAQGRFDDIAKSVVVIQAGKTHGSGIFITNQGHILTNAHVVGLANRVRIKTHKNRKRLPAEVLRIDRVRDVALLKLEEIPDDMPDIKTLPIRLDDPAIGDDVYAIGAPLKTRLQDTVTKGIISARRYNSREKQHYIQADVAIHGGSSGGPLLDNFGNLIGLSVSGYGAAELGFDAGLNNFIPIKDGLEKLNITIGAPQSTRPISK